MILNNYLILALLFWHDFHLFFKECGLIFLGSDKVTGLGGFEMEDGHGTFARKIVLEESLSTTALLACETCGSQWWCNVCGKAAVEIWNWSFLGVKGSTLSLLRVINAKMPLQPRKKYDIHAVWRTWLCIACSGARWLCYTNSRYVARTIAFFKFGRIHFLSLGVNLG